jgi:hypothetical protein
MCVTVKSTKVNGTVLDAGLVSITQTPLVGTSTDLEGRLDSGMLDLGFHYMDWDLTGIAKLSEIIEIADYWLSYDPSDPNNPNYVDPNVVDPNDLAGLLRYGGDLDGSGFVDYADFSIMAANWAGRFGPEPMPLSLLLNQEPNQITGDLTVTLDTVDPLLHRITLWMDGKIISDISPNGDDPGQTTIQTHNYRNGTHELKVFGFYEDEIITSPITEVVFNNDLSSVVQPKGFTYGQDYRIDGITEYDYHVQLYDEITETTVYDANCYGGLSLTLPAAAFGTDYGIYTLSIEKQEPEQAMMILSLPSNPTKEELVEYFIGKKFDISDPNNQYRGIVISIGSKNMEVPKEKCWKGVLKAAVHRRIWPILLKYDDCTWDNLNYCLHLPRVTMWYHMSHGNYENGVWYPNRQNIETKDGPVFSYLKKDYATPPTGYEDMGKYEKCHSLVELGFQSNRKLNWVQFNACRSARSDEFAYALGILPPAPNDPIGSQVFIGWSGNAKIYDAPGDYNTFEKNLWEHLTVGNSLQQSVDWSIPGGQDGDEIMLTFTYRGVASDQYIFFNWPKISK